MKTRRAFIAAALPVTTAALRATDLVESARARFLSGDFREASSLLAAALLPPKKYPPAEEARLRATLGRYQFRAGELAKAEESLLAALQSQAIEPVEAGVAKHYLAEVYTAWERKEDRGKIAPLLQQSIAALERGGGEEYAAALLLQAALDKHGFDAKIQRIFDVAGPEENPTLARALLVKGRDLIEHQQYVEGSKLFDQSEAMSRRVLPEGHPERFSAALRRANVLIDNKAFDRAGGIVRAAMAGKIAKLGSGHFEVLSATFSLGAMTHQQGCAPEAARIFERLVESSKRYGEHNLKVARAQSRLALILQELGRYQESEQLYNSAIPALEDYYGENDPAMVAHLHNEAVLFENQVGGNERAEVLLERCLKIIGNGPDDRVYEPGLPPALTLARVQQLLAIIYWKTQRTELAIPMFEKGAALNDRVLEQVLASTPEDEKRGYVAGLRKLTNLIRSFHALGKPDDLRVQNLAFTNVLRRNGRVLETLLDETAVLRSQGDAGARARFERIVLIRNQRARISTDLFLSVRIPPSLKAQMVKLDQSLFEEQREAEGKFAQTLAPLRSQQSPAGVDDIASKLPLRSVFIQFVSFRKYFPHEPLPKRWGDSQYVAYLVFPDGRLKFQDIGDAAAIGRLVSRFHRAVIIPKRSADAEALLQELYGALIGPIRPLLDGVDHLVIAPDGELNLIPFAALCPTKGSCLIQQFTVSYVSSGREVVRWGRPPGTGTGVWVFANPDFGSPGARTIVAQPLRHTKREAQAILDRFPEAVPRTDLEASKAELMAVPSPRILHLATHGLFFGEDLRQRYGVRGVEYLVAPGAKPPAPPPCAASTATDRDVNPLLRSLLLFAGANAAPQSADNGILTAVEASSLELSETEMVVASACRSGAGKLDDGEGVYGLRRAFALAGARSQVLTLWNVDDSSSADLMASFYTRLKAGSPRAMALCEAQRQMSKLPVYYWAGYILSGDTRPITF